MWFMHDESSIHFGFDATQYLNEKYPDRSVSWFEFIGSVWDYLKTLVYKTSVYDENILQMRIIDKCKKIGAKIKLFK